MAITEDDVKEALVAWLEQQGYTDVHARLGRAQGDDVEGVHPETGRRLVVECKGETEASNQWDRAWRNASQAFFKMARLSESKEHSEEDLAMAFPDTENYRKRMAGLQELCARQGIDVYWVSEDGTVRTW